MWDKNKQSGFTIVELLIVIVVIGIIAAITIVAYSGIQARAQVAAVSSGLEQAAKKLALYAVDSNAYPPDLATVGVNNTTGTIYQYSVNNSITPQTYCVTATNGSTSYSISSTITNPIVGGCAGHGLSGVSAVTNLMTNPEAISSGVGWYSNVGTVHTVTKGVSVTGNPSGITTAARSQLVSGQTSSQVLSMYNIDGMDNSATPRSISVWIYVNTTGYQSTIYGTGNPGTTTTVPLLAAGWALVKTAAPLTGNAILAVGKISGNADPADYAYATGSIVVAGSKNYNFADGNSPNWVWNGAPNASTSTGPLL